MRLARLGAGFGAVLRRRLSRVTAHETITLTLPPRVTAELDRRIRPRRRGQVFECGGQASGDERSFRGWAAGL